LEATEVIDSGNTSEVNDCVPAKQFESIVSTVGGITRELRLIHR
jgi:hypothetical protein